MLRKPAGGAFEPFNEDALQPADLDVLHTARRFLRDLMALPARNQAIFANPRQKPPDGRVERSVAKANAGGGGASDHRVDGDDEGDDEADHQ